MNKYRLVLSLVLVFSLITRVWRLNDPPGYYFDEVYHAFTAKYYATNDPRGYEWWHTSPEEGTAFEWLHPPLAKLLQGLSIRCLGVNSLAWRLPSAVFGVLVVGMVYLLAKSTLGGEKAAVMAAGLASLDGLLLAQSRIAMNDIFVTFFMLAAFWCYWNYLEKKKQQRTGWWLAGAGSFTGLAVATKWSGVFVVLVVGMWELGNWLRKRERGWLVRWFKLVVAFGVVPAVIYVLSYGQFWLQGHSIDQFKELHRQIWWYQTHLEATHPYQSRPWQWVLNIKPVWTHVNYEIPGKVGNIYAQANPVIAWMGLIAMGWMLISGIKEKNKAYMYLVGCYLLVWTPWIASPRIMFFYHYTPAVPFLCIALAEGLVRFNKKWGYGLVLGLVAGLYVWLFPYWTGVPVPRERVKYYAMFHDPDQFKEVVLSRVEKWVWGGRD